jgi:hypothetical protein
LDCILHAAHLHLDYRRSFHLLHQANETSLLSLKQGENYER